MESTATFDNPNAVPSPPVSKTESAVTLEDRHANMAKLGAFLVFAIMVIPMFLGQIYIADDLLNYHLPIRQFYSHALQNGDAFDWMPSLFNGFYLTGSGQAGTYHPWHWMLYRCLPVSAAFNLELISSYPFMLAGMVLFLKRHLKRRDAAWLGGIIFTFSGFSLMHFLHPNAIAVIAHLPWLLLALDVVLRPRNSSRRTRLLAEAGIPLLTASQLLLGYPQYVWFSLLAEMIYCLAFGGTTLAGWKSLLRLSFLKLLGLLIGAVQILPSLDALKHSVRNQLPADFVYRDPLTLADMLQWIGPYLTQSRVFGENSHELSVYCGALPVLLVIVAFWGKKSLWFRSPLVRTMTILGVVALWLSFGQAGGLYVLQAQLPFVGSFRWPSRGIVLVHFAVAVIAAAGYSRLAEAVEKGEDRLPPVLKFVSILSLVAAIGTWMFYKDVASPTQLLLGPVLFVLAWQMLKEFSRGALCLGLMLFVVGDLAAYGLNYAVLGKTKSMQQIQAEIDAPLGSPNDGRVVGEIQIMNGPTKYKGNALLLAGWNQADGYEGLLPQMHLLGENTTLDSLRIAGVKWVVNDGWHDQIKGLIQSEEHPDWLEVPNPLPRVRLTRNLLSVASATSSTKKLSADDHVVVLEEITLPSGDENKSTQAIITSDRPGNIKIQTDSASSQLLVLSEHHHPGWRVTVNGHPTILIRADLDFMGCVVPAGTNKVQFEFQPDSLRQGKVISLWALGLLFIYVVTQVFLWRRGCSTLQNEND